MRSMMGSDGTRLQSLDTPPSDDLATPAPMRPDRPRAAALRSALMLETASALVARPDWDRRQAIVHLRSQGAREWSLALFASDAASSIEEVASGQVQFGIVNPAVAAALALRGAPPFGRPIPLRAIATEPSFDQLGLAVRADLGIGTVSELVARRPPLRVSVRAQRDHSVVTFIEQVLKAAGASLAELEQWGGHVSRDDSLPHHPLRRDRMVAGDIDALFDEGIYNWVDQAVDAGFRFLSIDPPVMEALIELGHRVATLTPARLPALDAPITTIDFSGFLVYTHADTPDDVVAAFCEALADRADRIPWQGYGPLPLRRMLADAIDAPIPIPFHDAAARVWDARGLMSRNRSTGPAALPR